MKTQTSNNQKPLTLMDVAQELGVSRSTVSAAFTGNGNITAARREAVRSAAIDAPGSRETAILLQTLPGKPNQKYLALAP